LSTPEHSAATDDRITVETGQGQYVRLIEMIACEHAVLAMASMGPFPERQSVGFGIGDV